MALFNKSDRYKYTKQAIKEGAFSTEEATKRYQRFARLKNARITRLEKAFPQAEILKEVERSPSLKEFLDESGNIKDWGAFASEMSEQFKFLNKETTKVTGYRKQLKESIRTFNEILGENVINEDNIHSLYNFLEDYRQKNNVQKIPDSDRVIDIYAESIRLNINPQSLLRDIDYWETHLDEMFDLEPAESDEMVDSEYYKNMI